MRSVYKVICCNSLVLFARLWPKVWAMTVEQFYQICDAIVPDEYGCLTWPNSRGSQGYGFVYIDGRQKKVHRLALERKLGRPIQPGLLACHHCDCTSCVNSEHLYEGTISDNLRDLWKRDAEYRTLILDGLKRGRETQALRRGVMKKS